MLTVYTNQNMAKIAMNKSLLKEFETDTGRTVYLKNNDEFQIQLFNPTQDDIAASIVIDGKELSNQIIIKPAQRIWLERYLDTPRKFKFSTYEVDDTAETESIIQHNGEVEVRFYNKQKYPSLESLLKQSTYIINTPSPVYTNDVLYNSVNIANDTYSLTDLSCSLGVENAVKCSATIETGRTKQGSYSSQTLKNVNMDFEYFPFKTEKIKILPESRKPYTANDLEKIYCTECGRKLKTKFKFCPYCGTKIDY